MNNLGIIESRIFPSLVLSINQLVHGNLAEVLALQQKQFKTKKHKNYCQELRSRQNVESKIEAWAQYVKLALSGL